jgi:RNA polymerase sigma factor (sigma-70 family)
MREASKMEQNELLKQITKFLSDSRVKRLCRSYSADLDDAACELYLKLTKISAGKQIRHPRTWTVHNGMGLLQNWLRREVRFHKEEAMQGDQPLNPAFDCALIDESTAKRHEILEPREFHERREICEIVARKMDRIPQWEKEAVEAYLKVSGESCRQVARRYGVAAGTVSNWAKACIANLRPQLEGCR